MWMRKKQFRPPPFWKTISQSQIVEQAKKKMSRLIKLKRNKKVSLLRLIRVIPPMPKKSLSKFLYVMYLYQNKDGAFIRFYQRLSIIEKIYTFIHNFVNSALLFFKQ